MSKGKVRTGSITLGVSNFESFRSFYGRRRGYPGDLARAVIAAIARVNNEHPKPKHMTWDQWHGIVSAAVDIAVADAREGK